MITSLVYRSAAILFGMILVTSGGVAQPKMKFPAPYITRTQPFTLDQLMQLRGSEPTEKSPVRPTHSPRAQREQRGPLQTSAFAKANSAPLSYGDILVGIDSGRIRHYDSLGTYLGDLQVEFDSVIASYTSRADIAGMAVDWEGNLYATVFQHDKIAKFSPEGNFLGYFGTTHYYSPESMVKDFEGSFYVGLADANGLLTKFDKNGTSIDYYTLPIIDETERGTDWIQLAPDQRTLYYTSESQRILRYDLKSRQPLPDFATVEAPEGVYFYAMRLRDNGEVLVAADSLIYRFDTGGFVVDTYADTGSNLYFGLTLDPDENTFWATNYLEAKIQKFDIESGALLQTIDVTADGPAQSVQGIMVYGENGNGNTARIGGMKYYDYPQTSIGLYGRVRIANSAVELTKPGGEKDTAYTDSIGIYQFSNLAAGQYTVRDLPAEGFAVTSPLSANYLVAIGAGASAGQLNFGEVDSSSKIAGFFFNDQNANGVRDEGEIPLSGWTVIIEGDVPGDNGAVFQITTSDGEGNFEFSAVPPAHYTIFQQWQQDWILTSPGEDAEYAYEIDFEGFGEVRDDIIFGNAPPVYSASFRTFSPDSIVYDRDNKGKYGKTVKRKNDKCEFRVTMFNDSSNVNGLFVDFAQPILPSRTFSVFGASKVQLDAKGKKWYFKMTSPKQPGDSLRMFGWSAGGKVQNVASFQWARDSVRVGEKRSDALFRRNTLHLPMPNRLNVIQEMFAGGDFPEGLTVGIRRADSPDEFGWVTMGKFGDVVKSVGKVKRGVAIAHNGDARGFDQFANEKQFVGGVKSLPPAKHNNGLFTRTLALKLSLNASEMERTPPGLGALIYDDRGTNPLNGLRLSQLADRADSLLMGGEERTFAAPAVFQNIDTTIDNVLNAFEGAVDSVSFAAVTSLLGTDVLYSVPFLRSDDAGGGLKIHSSDAAVEALPKEYALHQNYPNPFNPYTTIEYDLPYRSIVTLTIYDVIGREVERLVDGVEISPGRHRVQFDAGLLSTGVYFCRLTSLSRDGGNSEERIHTRKMILIR